MEGTFWEKFSLLLVALGLILAGIGAVATFAWGFANTLFYIGLFVAIIGFALAVLYRINQPKK